MDRFDYNKTKATIKNLGKLIAEESVKNNSTLLEDNWHDFKNEPPKDNGFYLLKFKDSTNYAHWKAPDYWNGNTFINNKDVEAYKKITLSKEQIIKTEMMDNHCSVTLIRPVNYGIKGEVFSYIEPDNGFRLFNIRTREYSNFALSIPTKEVKDYVAVIEKCSIFGRVDSEVITINPTPGYLLYDKFKNEYYNREIETTKEYFRENIKVIHMEDLPYIVNLS